MGDLRKPSSVKLSRAASRGLRPDFAAALARRDGPGGIGEDAHNLLALHGICAQRTHDFATPRKPRGEDTACQVMAGLHIPSGVPATSQCLAQNALADRHASAMLRVTTRQPVQFHTMLRDNMAPATLVISDVVRNRVTAPAPRHDAGRRLPALAFARVCREAFGATLEPLFAAFATPRLPGEGFGDFCHRVGVDALRALVPEPGILPARAAA